ncbi:MAG: 4Fe-4S binding protein [Myxococcota bacterium]
MRKVGVRGWLLHDVTHRGITAWLLAAVIFAFYIVLYFGGQYGIPDLVSPWAEQLGLSSKWVLYGALYSAAIVLGGFWMLWKYRHNRYQVVRTLVVMVVQVTLGFSVPQMLKHAGQPEYYFSYLWPLKIDYFYPYNITGLPWPYVVYSVVGALVMVPVLGVFFGKRWYCSWVCGCGGLANTAGEPFRHLTSKSTPAWRFEKVAIHTVLIAALLATALAIGSALLPEESPIVPVAGKYREFYGIIVGGILSGVIGVGLYPIGGTRAWCRNFCPMAAILGLVQKLGRFRIRVKKDMCISCGLCSKYCEMGIDVRSYAQANQSFTRASCVGCGMCAEVCPRGVLTLENVTRKDPQEAVRRAPGRASLPIIT